MTRGGRLVKGSAVSDGLMIVLIGGTKISDVLILVSIECGLDVMLKYFVLIFSRDNSKADPYDEKNG